jgi:hypothetical protein
MEVMKYRGKEVRKRWRELNAETPRVQRKVGWEEKPAP